MTESPLQNQSFEMDVMVFNVGVTLYAIDLKFVKEIILPSSHLAQLPITPPLLKGLILSRDEIYPLVHLGEHSTDLTDDEARVILLTEGERRIALYTEQLHDILVLSSTNKMEDEASIAPESTHGAFETEKGNVLLLDFEQLYASLVDQANKADSIPIS
jgi:chemotaxis signal transduction protein